MRQRKVARMEPFGSELENGGIVHKPIIFGCKEGESRGCCEVREAGCTRLRDLVRGFTKAELQDIVSAGREACDQTRSVLLPPLGFFVCVWLDSSAVWPCWGWWARMPWGEYPWP